MKRISARIVVGLGLACMVLGALDPFEGSVVILLGAGLAAAGAFVGRSAFRVPLLWAAGLVAVGVALLFGASAVGGFGGRSGRSMWWAAVLLPYPVGWLLGMSGAVRCLREKRPSP
jgi:hypothetical protein